jgi:hypothetical protein
MEYRHLDRGCAGYRQQLVIFTRAPVAIEPAKSAPHNPTSGDDHKSLERVRTLHNLPADGSSRPPRLDPVHQGTGIRPIDPDML